ncbi:MAG: S9 family peptidase [Nitrospirae bacterium]|nr:S9 family peptidase [Nitrospirota bacterium]MBI3803597.1 S9 family peptidase [Candidatus Manganitrophaceae bacterium]
MIFALNNILLRRPNLNRPLLPLAIILVLFSGSTDAFAELPPLIPRDLLFGNPERTTPQISPDGKRIAFIAPDEKNILQIWVRTMGQQDDKMISSDKKRGIRRYFWTYDSDQLMYLKDNDGDENYHLYAVNMRTNVVRDMTPFQGVQADLVALDPNFPDEMLVGLNLRDSEKQDVYRVNLKNGAVELDTENPGNMVDWITDAQFKVRAGTATTPEGGAQFLYRDSPEKPWKILRVLQPTEEGRVASLSLDGKTLFAISNQNANAERLLAINIETGKEAIVAEDPIYDIGNAEFGAQGILIHPGKKTIQAVAFYRDRLQWQALDKSISADLEALEKIRKGQINIINRDLSDKLWVVSFTSDDAPVYYYIYDRSLRTAKALFSNQPKIEGLTLAQMKPISFGSRDGLTIHGYLTVPPGIPAKNLPTVLLVHGGPWVRDTWGFNPQAQWLANRGYAVLMINYRGSSGYGKKFLNAGDREWGGKMQNDLTDGVNWIVKEGIADKKKIAIMGRSYGGYAVLAGLAFTPDVFAAGVDIVGPSNIISLLKSIPPDFVPMKAMYFRRVGDPEKDMEFLKLRSPLFSVEQVKAPLLVIQGANDPRVKKKESEQMVEALRKANKVVNYFVYSDEGHYFLRSENRLHLNSKIEEFLAKQLGGRLEPVGEIKGHSAVEK